MATITKTISKNDNLSPDAETIQEAFDLCLDDGNDYDLQILDTATYTEQAELAARTSGGTVHLRSTVYSRNARPIVTISGVDGNLLTLKADHKVTGIHFVYDENVQGDAYRRCVYVPTGFAEYSEVYDCIFDMGGRYLWDAGPPSREFGHCGYFSEWEVDEVYVYNNVFRRCGYIGCRVDPASGDTFKIYNNTFVKCQEGITVETGNLANGSIYNNIFDMDPDFSPDCNNFYAIFVHDTNIDPDDFALLDYNLYYFRNSGLALTTWVYWSRGGSDYKYERLADLQAAHSVEANGIEQQPMFCTYCADYHLKPSSPCIGAGTAAGAPSGDGDGETRPTPPAIGAYEGLCESAIGVQIDKKQNDTYWVRVSAVNTKQRTGESEVSGRVNLKYLRWL